MTIKVEQRQERPKVPAQTGEDPVDVQWDPKAANTAQEEASKIRRHIGSYVTAIIQQPGLRRTRINIVNDAGEQRSVSVRKYIRIMRREAVARELAVERFGGKAALEAYARAAQGIPYAGEPAPLPDEIPEEVSRNYPA